MLEKESSGMYFSGHIIDSYSKHLDKISPDKISEILQDTSEENTAEAKYKDRSQVKIAGIITSKKTKVTKSGDTMAFLTVEDRYAEIEVIVFAKNYSKLSGIINEEAAVLISGTVSTEEGEASRILLSDISLLRADSDSSPEEAVHDVTVYIKVPSLLDKRIANLQRMAALNRGNSKVVLFDESTKKYSGMKSILIDPSDKVINKLKSLFSEENVIVK